MAFMMGCYFIGVAAARRKEVLVHIMAGTISIY